MFKQYWPTIKRHLISFTRVFLAAFVFFIGTTPTGDYQALLKGAAIAGISAVAKAIYEALLPSKPIVPTTEPPCPEEAPVTPPPTTPEA